MTFDQDSYDKQQRQRARLEKGAYTVEVPGQKPVYINDLQKYVVLGIGCHQISRGMMPLSFDMRREYGWTGDPSVGLWLPVPGQERVNVGYGMRKALEAKKLVEFEVINERFGDDDWGNREVVGSTNEAKLMPAGWAAFGMFIGQYAEEIRRGEILEDFYTGNFDPEGDADADVEDDGEAHADLGRFAGIF